MAATRHSWARRTVLGLLIATTLQACATTTAGAAEDVRNADLALAQAVATHDHQAFARLVDPDAVFLSSGISRGRDAVVSAWAPLIDRGRSTTLTWKPTFVYVAHSGDLAYTIGDYELRTITSSGTQEIRTGSYMTVWRRGADGVWRAAADSGSVPRPPDADGPGASTRSR